MQVNSVNWVGVRTDQYETMAGFFRDVIELRRAGAELIGERHTTESSYSWQHFRAPDGKVFELCHDPDR